MQLFWTILRKSFADFKEESTLLILFNMVWVVGSLPGMFVIGYGAVSRYLPVVLMGVPLLILWPYTSFGLFWVVNAIGERNAVGFKTFFVLAGRQLRIAYVWGGLNLLVYAILLSNIRYYTSQAAPLGGSIPGDLLGSLFVTITVMWTLWQPFVLAIFPRLSNPGFRLAYRQAGHVILSHPIPVFVIMLITLALAALALLVPPFGFLIAGSAIAVVANRTVVEIMASEQFKRWDPGLLR